jgi:hypothetical protein
MGLASPGLGTLFEMMGSIITSGENATVYVILAPVPSDSG